ncbi:MAG: NAD-dependent epimerase [Myxococcales bacterium]|nr:NAD-dependent epimerase [Myxococcales bacterium]
MQKKALVIGGSGFLGSHVADALSAAGMDVTIFDHVESKWISSNQKFIQGNLLDKSAILSACKGIDYVYHMAGVADIGEASNNPLLTIESNVMGSSIVLSACVEQGVERFVFASTVYVYSQRGSFYRASKQSVETLIEAYHEKYGLNYTILRYGSLYGPRAQDWNGFKNYILQAVRNNRIVCNGTGEERREYIHVKDASRLSVEALQKDFENKCLTLTGAQVLKVKELFAFIKEIVGKDIEFEFEEPGGESDHYLLTPYRYTPRQAVKIEPRTFVDIGQGVLDVVEEIAVDSESTAKRAL